MLGVRCLWMLNAMVSMAAQRHPDVQPAPIRGKGQAPTPARTGNYLGTTTTISSRDPGTCQHCGKSNYTKAKDDNITTEKDHKGHIYLLTCRSGTATSLPATFAPAA
jgi:hypothetical protein